jgi:RNA polymerase sigma-70 factor (ECF subfamily)
VRSPRPHHLSTSAPSDEDRFQALYLEQFDYVWETFQRLGVPQRDLEDLAQELFVIVYQQLGDYDPARPIRPWLFGIAFRVVSRYRRSGKHAREVLTEVPEEIDESASPFESVVIGEERALVLETLDALDLDRRAVFVMHELDEVPIPEVARVLEIPLNTAYSRLRLARKAFSAALLRRRLKEGPIR